MKSVLVMKGIWSENPFMVEFATLLARVGVKHEFLVNHVLEQSTLMVDEEAFNTHKQSIKDNIRELFYMVKFIDAKLMGKPVVAPAVEEAELNNTPENGDVKAE